MTCAARNQVTDLRGTSRMLVDAITGITHVVEAMHTNIVEKPTGLAGAVIGAAVNGTTSAVYKTIRGVTRAVGGGIDLTLGALAPALGHVESSPARESLIAVLNGVLGDYLAEAGNPLAVTMCLRRDGRPVELTREGLAACAERPTQIGAARRRPRLGWEPSGLRRKTSRPSQFSHLD